MLVTQAFRVELDPNNRVAAMLASHCGATRFVYNWGCARVTAQWAEREKVRAAALKELLTDEEVERLARNVALDWTFYSLRAAWNREKQLVAPWWRENSKFAYESGLEALGRALANYSDAKHGRRKGEMGFPRRKKRWARRSCRFWSAKLLDERHVKLPRIPAIRTKESLAGLLGALESGTARLCLATVSEEAGRWFVSLTCEMERIDAPALDPDAVVGIDLGVKHLATLSTGAVVENPRALSRYERELRRLTRTCGRRQRGSKRHARAQRQRAVCHRKVRNLRNDALHQLSATLAKHYGTVVVEDLHVKGMTASAKGSGHWRGKAGLNRAILDVAPGKLRRQLEYKIEWRGGRLIVADRFYPSSKICSACGAVRAKLSLAERTYYCEECGLEMDRDLNAALNLADFGRRHVAAGAAETKIGRRDERLQDGLCAVWCSSLKRQDGRSVLRQTVSVGAPAQYRSVSPP